MSIIPRFYAGQTAEAEASALRLTRDASVMQTAGAL
jgi:hypothetical protein